jgi:hypothetical protein
LGLWSDWDGRAHSSPEAEARARQQAVLKMRKLWPLYLMGFASAAQLRGQLLAASSLAEVDAAIEGSALAGGHDPLERCGEDAARAVRLKSTDGRPPQKVALPDGWLEGRLEVAAPDYMSDAAAEG